MVVFVSCVACATIIKDEDDDTVCSCVCSSVVTSVERYEISVRVRIVAVIKVN